MATLDCMWRSDRIAAIGQYAGADPYGRSPCPVPMEARRHVPLILLRNLCDGRVSCKTTTAWIDTLAKEQWPYKVVNLDLSGNRPIIGNVMKSARKSSGCSNMSVGRGRRRSRRC